jgi:DNA-binding protein H-NS
MPQPNLSSMSVDALLKLREDIGRALDRKAKELRSQLSRLGDAAANKMGRRGPPKGRKVPPKYRSPSGETWAGRGARPRMGPSGRILVARTPLKSEGIFL